MRLISRWISAGLWCAALLACRSVTAASLPAKPEKLKPAQAVDAYLAVVEDDGQTAVKRNYAAAQIVKLGDKAVPRIMALYRCAPAGRRGRLADVLSGMTTPDPEAV